MKENVRIRQQVREAHDSQADISQASRLGMGIILTFASLVGVWGVACLLGALSTQGVGAMVKGFITAVSGM